ncbi:MAG: tRNA (adenosine(37)-N6)-dimethylallyltransferase MiaA [Clostridia bacterium]|nr:tRNA (adenosine(37)-N6)-dimethylallyltransferase MiaA [Clostridia bacterium]
MKRVIVLAGPTASGKTKLGTALAEIQNGEIVSADSMQIYRDLPIATAQPTEEEKKGIPHHLIGFLPHDARFTVADWREEALRTIRDIFSRGKTPIVVGGTGMYIRYLIYEPSFGAESDPAVREKLAPLSNEELLARLLKQDARITVSVNDRKRLLRYNEVLLLNGRLPAREREKNTEFAFSLFCLCPDRAELYEKIDRRVDEMFARGLFDEIRALRQKGVSEEAQCYKAIGCRQLIDVLEGRASLEEAREAIKRESRRYAKRQITWMKSEQAVRIAAWDTETRIRIILKTLERI